MSDSQVILKRQQDGKFVIAGAALGASALVFEVPAMADTTAAATDPVTSVGTMITNISGVAISAAAVVIVAMGFRMAVKLVNRVATKG